MLLVNGHGGNVTAITDAIATLGDEGRQCHAWHAGLSPAQLAEAGIAAGVADAHAGRFETSIMLALAPELVLLEAAAPGETRPVADILPDLRERGVRAVSPNGVLGDPAGASAAEGRQLLSALVARLTQTLEELLALDR
jgi:creatinine amidohydrolase